MKKAVFCSCIALLAGVMPARAYNDHRGHKLDSLERVVAPWTQAKEENATIEQLLMLNNAYRNLMLGYETISSEKSVYYARRATESHLI